MIFTCPLRLFNVKQRENHRLLVCEKGVLTPRSTSALPYRRRYFNMCVWATLCLLLTQHTGGVIGLSTRLCSCSAPGLSRPVAAGGPLAWRQNSEMRKVSYQNQTTGTASYSFYRSLLLHTWMCGISQQGPWTMANLYSCSSCDFSCAFSLLSSAVRPVVSVHSSISLLAVFSRCFPKPPSHSPSAVAAVAA
jgi:hypothetical protein